MSLDNYDPIPEITTSLHPKKPWWYKTIRYGWNWKERLCVYGNALQATLLNPDWMWTLNFCPD